MRPKSVDTLHSTSQRPYIRKTTMTSENLFDNHVMVSHEREMCVDANVRNIYSLEILNKCDRVNLHKLKRYQPKLRVWT
jgi:hypothetical protein